MGNDYISYAAMKEIIDVLKKYDIPYSFGTYSTNDDIIEGHWLTIDTEIYTEELDENDHLYNEE